MTSVDLKEKVLRLWKLFLPFNGVVVVSLHLPLLGYLMYFHPLKRILGNLYSTRAALSYYGVYNDTAMLFNATMVIMGILLFPYCLRVAEIVKIKSFPKKFMYISSSISFIVIGMVTADYPHDYMCVQKVIHWGAALYLIVGFSLSMVITKEFRKTCSLAPVIGVVGFLGNIVIFFVTDYNKMFIELWFYFYMSVWVIISTINMAKDGMLLKK